jgi:3-hydroxybutyryl-CoA dehydrogenase
MPVDIDRPDLTLAVVGTGVMGRGIAQISAQAGIATRLFDAQPDAAANARKTIGATLDKLVERGRLAADAARATMDRITVVANLAELAGCHVVVEAIVERLDVKQPLFAELERVTGPDCILATNTSSLSVTSIAAACKSPERVAGFHFFNPVPLMKIVEVVDGALTAPAACDALMALARRMGHLGVRAKDTPGFIVNHAGRGFGTEALAIVREGVAEFFEIDRILREAAGFRMGPFELLDLTGLDVSHPVMESIYFQYYEEPRYRPSPLGAQRVAAGLLGRKSGGRGFYTYVDGNPSPMPVAPVPQADIPPVWIAGGGLEAEARTLLGKLGARIESGERPSAEALVVAAPLGHDATSVATRLGVDATRTVAIDGFVGFAKRRTLMTTPVTQARYRDAAHALLASDGVPVSVIHDSTGFVAQRVLAHIVNIGCDIAQQRVATPEDIDRAVTLGLGYPNGPLAWGDALGATRVLAVLEAMHALSGDPRYRPSPWLRRRAALGVSLTTPEA